MCKTITVKIKIIGEMSYLSSKREVELNLPYGSTLRNLFIELFEVVDQRLKTHLVNPYTKEFWPPPPIVLINGKHPIGSNDTVIINNGDEVVLLPPVAGG